MVVGYLILAAMLGLTFNEFRTVEEQLERTEAQLSLCEVAAKAPKLPKKSATKKPSKTEVRECLRRAGYSPDECVYEDSLGFMAKPCIGRRLKDGEMPRGEVPQDFYP